MRSTLCIGFLLWAGVCVHSLTRVEQPAAIHKRAASPQLYQPQGNARNQSQQFQWVKVNNQWVRSDGTKLPGYSQANVPYNQTVNQWNTPTPNRSPPASQPSGVNSWNSPQRPGNQSTSGWGQQPPAQQPTRPQSPPQSPSQQGPRRQNSASQDALGWNPDADRALTQDLPHTTPRPVQATTPRAVVPQTPPPAYRPPSANSPAATPPVNAPFGSGYGGQKRPGSASNAWNPDASLTYGTGGRSPPPDHSRTPANPNAGRPGPGSNPWGGLFNRR